MAHTISVWLLVIAVPIAVLIALAAVVLAIVPWRLKWERTEETVRERFTRARKVVLAVCLGVATVAAALFGATGSHESGSAGPSLTPGPSATGTAAASITALIREEAAYALPGHSTKAVRLYARSAFVVDAGCPSGRPQIWSGLRQIRQRYLTVGAFSMLRHASLNVHLSPDNLMAWATAQTVGVMAPSGRPVQGNEEWTFAFVNGHWKITSFINDLCTAPGGG